jgi:hypothetical protein
MKYDEENPECFDEDEINSTVYSDELDDDEDLY